MKAKLLNGINIYELEVGNESWSRNIFNKFLFATDKDIEDIRKAYWESCKTTGICFHDSANSYAEYGYDFIEVLHGHCDNQIGNDVVNMLKPYGFDPGNMFDNISLSQENEINIVVIDVYEFFIFLMWFISITLEDFKYELITVDADFNEMESGNLSVGCGVIC